MSDEEITVLVAEKVMGWERIESYAPYIAVWKRPAGPNSYHFLDHSKVLSHGHVEGTAFYPLVSNGDACAVVDKMDADGWTYMLGSGCLIPGKGPVICVFKKSPGERGDCYSEDRKRSIVFAALRAKGVEI